MDSSRNELMPVVGNLYKALAKLANLDKEYNRARHEAMVSEEDLRLKSVINGNASSSTYVVDTDAEFQAALSDAQLTIAETNFIEQAQIVVLLWSARSAAVSGNEEGEK